MSKMYKVLVSFILSVLIMGIFFEVIVPSKKDNSINGSGNNEVVSSLVEDFSLKDENLTLQEFATIEKKIQLCRESISGFDDESIKKKNDCRNKIEKQEELEKKRHQIVQELATKKMNNKLSKEEEFQSSIALVNAFLNSPVFILVIYLVLLLTLWMQMLIAFAISNQLTNKQETLIEWNINVPPILGVVGTIYAFASFTLVSEKQNGLFAIFKSNFYDAATTTIIGGSFYVINFAIAVWISSKIQKG